MALADYIEKKPVIDTARLRLRSMRAEDVPALLERQAPRHAVVHDQVPVVGQAQDLLAVQIPDGAGVHTARQADVLDVLLAVDDGHRPVHLLEILLAEAFGETEQVDEELRESSACHRRVDLPYFTLAPSAGTTVNWSLK